MDLMLEPGENPRRHCHYRCFLSDTYALRSLINLGIKFSNARRKMIEANPVTQTPVTRATGYFLKKSMTEQPKDNGKTVDEPPWPSERI